MKTVIALLALVAIAFALSERVHLEADRVVNYLPPGWTKTTEAVPADMVLKLKVMLKQQNVDELHAMVAAVSEVQSPLYGKWLSHENVIDLVHPSEETIETVEEWLAAAGIAVVDTIATGDIMFIEPTVAQAEELLEARFAVFLHEETNTRLVRCDGAYSVPTKLSAHVDLVVGVTNLPRIWAERQARIGKRQAGSMVGPAELRARYNVSAVGTNETNKMAVAEFQGQYYSPSDLTKFFNNFVSNSGNDTVTKVVGTNNVNDPGVEASLDIEYIMGVAPNVPSWFYSWSSMAFFDDLTEWQALLSNESDIPYVHSVSYGDQTMAQPSVTYKQRAETEFAKIVGRGISILFASGDTGSGCDLCVWLQPSYPATSCYVTSVGATQFQSGTAGPEEAVTGFSSGGGFSWVFDMPSWQTTAVESYLTNYKDDLPYGFMYNAKGRATPDVSALGWGFSVVVSGQTEGVGGTSAAAPTFSAVIALLNDQRLNEGKPVLGFLNSWLYASQQVPNFFYDVTIGSDPDGCCLFPFKCAPGWDATTGLGTPNMAVMADNMP